MDKVELRGRLKIGRRPEAARFEDTAERIINELRLSGPRACLPEMAENNGTGTFKTPSETAK